MVNDQFIASQTGIRDAGIPKEVLLIDKLDLKSRKRAETQIDTDILQGLKNKLSLPEAIPEYKSEKLLSRSKHQFEDDDFNDSMTSSIESD